MACRVPSLCWRHDLETAQGIWRGGDGGFPLVLQGTFLPAACGLLPLLTERFPLSMALRIDGEAKHYRNQRHREDRLMVRAIECTKQEFPLLNKEYRSEKIYPYSKTGIFSLLHDLARMEVCLKKKT